MPPTMRQQAGLILRNRRLEFAIMIRSADTGRAHRAIPERRIEIGQQIMVRDVSLRDHTVFARRLVRAKK